MPKIIWFAVAAVGAATLSYAVFVRPANAVPPTGRYIVSFNPLPENAPTAPEHDLPGADDELNKLPGAVSAQSEPDGPWVTQSPVELP